MRRIAFFGPLNPIRSGIADYNEELLPLLRKHYEIDVFTGNGATDRENVFPHSSFVARHTTMQYDLCLYQLGNALIHEIEYCYLFQYPGAVVFHDYVLHHARAKMLMLKGLFEEYLEEARWAHPEEPRLGTSMFGGLAGDLLLYYYPFVKLVLQASLAAAAHTDVIAQKLRVTETPVIKIPMFVDVEPPVDTASLYPGRIVLASFGLATPEKRIHALLNTLSDLRWYYPNLLYLVVGDVASHYDLRWEVERRGLEKFVEIIGYVDRSRFHQLMNRSDIIVNLRYPSAGEMSATLLRALALGKPVFLSRLEHLLEIPEDVAIRVRPDREQEDLFHNLWQLIERPSLRERYSMAALKYMKEQHRPDQTLEKYHELIETALQRKENFRAPELPMHLRSGREILRDYIRRNSFDGKESPLLDWIL